jgi:hypothetical protein
MTEDFINSLDEIELETYRIKANKYIAKQASLNVFIMHEERKSENDMEKLIDMELIIEEYSDKIDLLSVILKNKLKYRYYANGNINLASKYEYNHEQNSNLYFRCKNNESYLSEIKLPKFLVNTNLDTNLSCKVFFERFEMLLNDSHLNDKEMFCLLAQQTEGLAFELIEPFNFLEFGYAMSKTTLLRTFPNTPKASLPCSNEPNNVLSGSHLVNSTQIELIDAKTEKCTSTCEMPASNHSSLEKFSCLNTSVKKNSSTGTLTKIYEKCDSPFDVDPLIKTRCQLTSKFEMIQNVSNNNPNLINNKNMISFSLQTTYQIKFKCSKSKTLAFLGLQLINTVQGDKIAAYNPFEKRLGTNVWPGGGSIQLDTAKSKITKKLLPIAIN